MYRQRLMIAAALIPVLGFALFGLVPKAVRGVGEGTVRVSLSSANVQPNGVSTHPDISASGRFVAFQSTATNLVAGDTSAIQDIFVRDRDADVDGIFDEAGAVVTERMSVSTAGVAAGTPGASNASISADGRWVAFDSSASNLVTGDTNNAGDAFVRDRDTDADGIFDEAGAVSTIRVTTSAAGVQGNGHSGGGALSPDARFISFLSGATNLVAGADANGNSGDVFIRDRDTDVDGIFDESGAVSVVRVSAATDGTQGNAQSNYHQMSADARHVAFLSDASNLVAGDTNMCAVQNNAFLFPCPDIFVRDRDTDADGIFDEPGAVLTRRVSVDSAGAQSNDRSCYRMVSSNTVQLDQHCPRISADGRSVTFTSVATNLVAGDNNINCVHAGGDIVPDNCPDVFVHDRDADNDGIFDEAGAVATNFVSITTSGTQANAQSSTPDINGDGRFITFDSTASNLVAGDTNGGTEVFILDRDTDADGIFDEPGAISTTRVSLANDGSQAIGASLSSGVSSLSPDGLYVGFSSNATNLVAGDTNGLMDTFVRNRGDGGWGDTPTPTSTSSPTTTSTPTATATATATATPTRTNTPTATATSTFTSTPTPPGTATSTPTATSTVCAGDDVDCDGFKDPPQLFHLGPSNTITAFDNCPATFNPTQLNTDGNHVDTSPPYVVAIDDKTWPNSDILGDACDSDDDSDGISDADEGTGAACGGIVTNAVLFDTDGDQARDGAECALGTNPTNAASEPALAACGAAGDADGDKIATRIEFCYYGSNTASVDSDGDAVGGLDGDGGRDGCEIASINGDQVVSSGDQGKLASGISGSTPYHAGVDINKDGLLNSGDQGTMASFISPPGQCPG